MSSTPSFPIVYVRDSDVLGKMLEDLRRSESVCLDLEADSMYHYHAKICLVQILAGDTCYLLDTLADLPLEAALRELGRKHLIVHGGDYDLRMLYQLYGFRPRQVFDTMLAAQLLGKSAFGLAALVGQYFEVVLDKEHQKADWSLRPLSPEMLSYAAQDTFFLPGLHARLTEELRTKGRVDWHRQTCDLLIENTAKLKAVDTENAWRVDGSYKLYPRQLAALQKLWQWREAAAQERNRPSYRILPTDLLMRFAMSVPAQGEPESLPSLPNRLRPELKQEFRNAWREALALPPEKWPEKLRPARKAVRSPDSRILAHLKAVRDKLAEDLEMDPALLAPKSTLIAVAMTGLKNLQDVRRSAAMMPWQEQLLLEAWLGLSRKAQTHAARPQGRAPHRSL